MRKLLFAIVALLSFWACNDEQMVEQQSEKVEFATQPLSRSTFSGLGVDQQILYLKDDSTRLAGKIEVSSLVPEVSLQWNFPDSCNVDTTRTHLAMKNGSATLDVKWDQILERGNFGPDGTAFDGGVLISDGSSSIYVHLIWTEQPVAAAYSSKILTRSASEASGMDKAVGVSVTPAELKLLEYNGNSARLKLSGVEYTYFEFDRIGSYTNIAVDQLPEHVEGNISRFLEFRWIGGPGHAPTTNFRVPYHVIAEEEGMQATGWLRYSKAEEDTLSVTPTELNISSLGGMATSKVTTNDDTWQVTSTDIPNWLTLSTMRGSKGTSTLTFTVPQNPTNQERSFTVYIETSGKSKGIIVNQLGVIPSLSVDPSSFTNLNAKGTTASLNVTSNTGWSIVSAVPNWLTPSIHTGDGSATVNFTVAQNTAPQSRTYTLTLSTMGGSPKTVDVIFTQNGAEPNSLTVTASPTTIGYQGGVSSLTITSNASWSVSSNASWARVVDATGSSKGSSDIIVQENTGTDTRTATITVTTTDGSPTITRTVTITQQPKSSPVTPGSGVTIGDFQNQDVNVNGGDL